MKCNPLKQVSETIEVSSAWKREQKAIERRKNKRRQIEGNAAVAQRYLSEALVLKPLDPEKFVKLSEEMFSEEKEAA